MGDTLKHYRRIDTMREDDYRSFVLIECPNDRKTGTTFVRCKIKDIRREMLKLHYFSEIELDKICSMCWWEKYEFLTYGFIMRIG